MKLINATGEMIKDTLVKDYEKDEGFNENTLYKNCINGMKKVRLNDIDSTDIEGPIQTFLINWGTMARVLNQDKKWKKKLMNVLRNKSHVLDSFRDENLLYKSIKKAETKNKLLIVMNLLKNVLVL
ncbi:MAG: hypothetical protein QHH19_05085 [Candidatus Thermoplasmatota archaeon]|jgi:hypothetical protein|nr:hypothetical protein [Candidatus Thermoplasmatota archaeon]